MKKNEILKNYNISDATLRNWKKLGYVKNINDIEPSEIDDILKNKVGIRRNKRTSEENIIPYSYINDKNIIPLIVKILDLKNKYKVSIDDVLYKVIILLVKSHNLTVPKDIEKILCNRSNNVDFSKEFNEIKITYEENNDFLGCLYMSLLSVGKKDTNGIFYTPYKIVNEIVESIKINQNEKIVDPGCGSGNFLIQIYKKMKSEKIPTEKIINNIYGFDIDPVACFLAKINIYLLDNNIEFNKINIHTLDYLNDECNIKFDHIIGNPPWGKKYNAEEKRLLKEKYGIAFSKLDSFSQFILHSFDLLNDKGYLSFVLPSSILNIAVHESIRKFLLNNKIIYIKKIGREFTEIVTDVILLQVRKEEGKNNTLLFNNDKIKQELFNNNSNSNFIVTDEIAMSILNKVKNHPHYHLDKGVEYALGIVTGNNKEYISNIKQKDYEPIISGKEITKYKFNYQEIKNYIKYERNKLQQVANENLYRNKNKIIYKFIGKKLCFAIENKGILTLNSANIICLDDSFDINYISAVLNSRITQLFFDESFDTHKVLKNHIKSFYIPLFKESITSQIALITSKIASCEKYNEEIENILYSSLKLTDEEIEYLKSRYN